MGNLKPRSCAQFAPGCIFGHVNGVLRICTRVQIFCNRVQICSCLRGVANLFLYILLGDFDKWEAFSITMLFKID